MIISLANLVNLTETTLKEINGRWVPARPESGGFRCRIKAAWAVLTGKADAVVWPANQ